MDLPKECQLTCQFTASDMGGREGVGGGERVAGYSSVMCPGPMSVLERSRSVVCEQELEDCT